MDLHACFNVLGLDPATDATGAKRAYKACVRRWHPDQFPEGSAAKAQAEEQLKQINVAYARILEHFRLIRPATPTAGTPPPNAPAPPQPPGSRDKTEKRPPKRSWVDHLFDRLNAFAEGKTDENATEKASAEPECRSGAGRRRSFQQILGEMAGEEVSTGRCAGKRKPMPGMRIRPGFHGGNRRRGGSEDAVGKTDRIEPVRPVSRVRGIGKSR